MSRAMWLLAAAVALAPLGAWLVYRAAKELGFLDPPFNAEHAERRTILVAMWAFLLFLSIFLFGFANGWPRIWAAFGVLNGIALVIFAGLGLAAARRLWRLRHPAPAPPSRDEAKETPVS